MVLVARYQQESVEIAVCEHPNGCNLSAIIDTCCTPQCHVGAADQIVQVNHRSTVLPQKRVGSAIGTIVVGRTRYLILGINLVGVTANLAGKSPEIRHLPVLPEKREERLIARVRGPAGDVPGLVDHVCSSVISSESPKVLHRSRLGPEEWVVVNIASEIGRANDLPVIVEGDPVSLPSRRAAQRSQVNHFAVRVALCRRFPKEWVYRHVRGVRRTGNLSALINERRGRIGTAESAYILHPVPFVPEKRTRLRPEAEQGVRIRGRIARESCDLSAAVHHARSTLISAECPEVRDLAAAPDDGGFLRPARDRIENTVDG